MFKLEFSTDNAAFDDCPATEAARILRSIAAKVESGESFGGPVRDCNGNTIGQWEMFEAERPEA